MQVILTYNSCFVNTFVIVLIKNNPSETGVRTPNTILDVYFNDLAIQMLEKGH